jgi:hypothetical protein
MQNRPGRRFYVYLAGGGAGICAGWDGSTGQTAGLGRTDYKHGARCRRSPAFGRDKHWDVSRADSRPRGNFRTCR